VAEKTLKLPRIGGGLSFVLATVAGHLWGVEAAKAIDDGARLFRELRSEVAKGLEDPGELNGAHAKDLFDKAMEFIVSGRSDSALPAAAAARLALFKEVMNRKWKNDQTDIGIISQLLDALNKVVEESTRTIDTIRHQAKTVTVGISRPQREIAPFVLDSLRGLGFEANSLGPRDRRLLEAISPVIIGLKGALLYEVIYESPGELNLDKVRIKAVKGLGESAAEDSRYASPGLVKGTKRKALRTGRIAFTAGPKGVENVLLAPIYEGSSPRSSHLFLTHLMLAQRASLQQKSDILDNLGSKYEELEEMTHELAVADDVDDVINETSPRDLVFCSVKEILENYGSLGI
jgi:glucosamine--fructose-6-phosphate aminotransferase (isomerizing)